MAGRRPTSASVPETWERSVLRLIAEQGAIPLDQLARFLEADERPARKIADHLSERGWTAYGRFLHGEPHWIWLTPRGCRLSSVGFSYLPPRVGAMARMRAINEIRLHICARAPEARWISGRTIFREQGHRGYRPAAVVEAGGEHHAILALLRPRPRDHLEPYLRTQLARHDAAIAFCSGAAKRPVQRLSREPGWRNLVVRDLPGPA